MDAGDSTPVRTRPRRSAQPRSLAAEVFDVAARHLAERSDAIALFTETGSSFEDWCTWEILAACRGAGWTVQPRPRYAEIGVAGSRDSADLLVFDPATGRRLVVELAIIHDWTTNKWIATLNGDTEKLLRPASGDTVGLQAIVTVSLASPIDVNPTWQGWLRMSRIFKEPGNLRHAVPLGAVGQMVVQGWEITK